MTLTRKNGSFWFNLLFLKNRVCLAVSMNSLQIRLQDHDFVHSDHPKIVARSTPPNGTIPRKTLCNYWIEIPSLAQRLVCGKVSSRNRRWQAHFSRNCWITGSIVVVIHWSNSFWRNVLASDDFECSPCHTPNAAQVSICVWQGEYSKSSLASIFL